MLKYNIGSSVRVVEESSKYFGKIGTVSRYWHDNPNTMVPCPYWVDVDGEEVDHLFEESELEVFFKVGDRVKAIHSSGTFYPEGDHGTVERVILPDLLVRWDNGKDGMPWFIRSDSAVLVLEEDDGELDPEPVLTDWKVRYAIDRDSKGNPTGRVECVLKNPNGTISYGKSKCNQDAGDVFTIKEGKRIARLRAECARDTHATAFFLGGEVMLACSIGITEEGIKSFGLEDYYND